MADFNDWLDDFDDSGIAPSTGFDSTPIPNGEYLLQIEKQEVLPTKDNTGVRLNMQLGVVEGDFENRKVFVSFNIRNKSAQAQAIAIAEFKALCLACGIEYEHAKRDTDMLDRIPFRAMVGLDKPQPGYAPKNRITRYIPKDATVAAAAAKSPAPAQAAPASKPLAKAAGNMPWKKTA
ncbi:MAG: DUF669 domain-containing protein [Alsobacter sp.]